MELIKYINGIKVLGDRDTLFTELDKIKGQSTAKGYLTVELKCGCVKSWKRKKVPKYLTVCKHGNSYLKYSDNFSSR